MSDFSLTSEQRQALRLAHRRFTDKRSADRIKCIYLMGSGWLQSEVCEALLLDAGTVRHHVQRYLEEGLFGLLETHFTGGKPKLNEQEMSALDQHLQERLYLDAKSIASYVQDTFQKSYSVRGITELLKRMDFVYKKPKVVPGKADPEAQKAFLEQYEALKRQLQPKDKILFMDGVHPQHNTVAAFGWIKKGQDKAIKSNAGRQRLNINGALDIKTCKAIVTYEATLNALTILNLFTKIRKAYRRAGKIYLICDNAGYYKPESVRLFAASLNIELVFLPPYAPNLNLIERFWKFFKKKVLYNQYYPKFSDFKEAVTEFFEDLKQYKSELKSLLTEKFQFVG
jgi:transposase